MSACPHYEIAVKIIAPLVAGFGARDISTNQSNPVHPVHPVYPCKFTPVAKAGTRERGRHSVLVQPHRVDVNPAIPRDGTPLQELPKPASPQQQSPTVPAPNTLGQTGGRPDYLNICPTFPRRLFPPGLPPDLTQGLLRGPHAEIGAQYLGEPVEGRVALEFPGPDFDAVKCGIVLAQQPRRWRSGPAGTSG